MNPRDQYYWCLDRLTEMTRAATSRGFSPVYIRQALVSALAIQEEWMLEKGLDPAILKKFDQRIRARSFNWSAIVGRKARKHE